MAAYFITMLSVFVGFLIGTVVTLQNSTDLCPIDLTTPRCENAIAVNKLHEQHPELFCPKG